MADVIELQERKRKMRCCGEGELVELATEEAQILAEDLQILAHPIRLQILDILTRNAGQVCVCDLEAALPVKQPTVSHHLRLLREAGLIDCERHGLWAYYFVKRGALAGRWGRISAHFGALV